MFKKWIPVGCALIVFFLLFQSALLNTGLRIYIERQASALGAPLAYASVESAPHTLSFLKPRMVLEGELSAEKLTFIYQPHFLKRQLELKVLVENPHVTLTHPEASFETLVKRCCERSNFFEVVGEVCCREGVLALEDNTLHFELNHTWGKQQRGLYFLTFGEKSHLRLSFTTDDPTSFDVQSELAHVELKQLSQAVQPFLPELCAWNVQKGQVDGEFALSFSHAQLKSGHGELTINDLAAEQTELGLSVAVDNASFVIDSEAAKAVLEIVKGGAVAFQDSAEPYATFRDFKGSVTLSDADKLELHMSGVWEDAKNPISTELRGLARLSSWRQSALKIFLNPLHDQPAYITLETEMLGKDNIFASIALHHFGPKQFHFWQRFLENFFPDGTRSLTTAAR